MQPMPAVEYSSKTRMRGIGNVNIHKKTSSYVDKPGCSQRVAEIYLPVS